MLVECKACEAFVDGQLIAEYEYFIEVNELRYISIITQKILFLRWRCSLRTRFIAHALQNLLLGFFIHNDNGNSSVNRIQRFGGGAVGNTGR